MHGTFGATSKTKAARRNDSWTFRQMDDLRENWPNVEKIKSLLRYRSESAIKKMAKRCGLVAPKAQHIWTAADQTKLRRMAREGQTQKAIAAQLGLTVTQVGSRMKYTKVTIAKRPPAPVGDPLVDSIRHRAFALNMSLAELDRSLGPSHAFRNSSGQKINPRLLHQAVEALGGRVVAEWLDE